MLLLRVSLVLSATLLVVAAAARTPVAECHGGATLTEAQIRADVSRSTELVARAEAATDGRRRASRQPVNLIDEEIFGAMKAAGVVPAPLSTDVEFLRRVTLDLTGQLPTPEEVDAFLADQRSNRRTLAVDRLLASEAFSDRWALFFGDLFRNTIQFGVASGPSARKNFHDYLRTSVRDGKPYDEMVRELITATGDARHNGPVNFVIRDFIFGTDPPQDTFDGLAVSTSNAFLGVNTFCISCHDGAGHTTELNSFLTSKKRAQFWESAAFFAKLRFGPSPGSPFDVAFAAEEDPAGEYETGTTSGNKAPRNPAVADGRRTIEPAFLLTGERPAPGEPRRAAYARMLTAHPQFARATVNYLWKEMFVLGIVEPVNNFDLVRPNQATHPRLLDRLGRAFAASGYNLRALLRMMALSEAYQLSASYPGEWKAEYTRLFARRFVRRLTAEEMHDAVSAATNVWIPIPIPSGDPVLRAGQLPDVVVPSDTQAPETRLLLDSFLRGNRKDTARSSELTLHQMLSLLNNSSVVAGRVESPQSRGRVMLARGDAPRDIVRALWSATLGRRPTAAEEAAALEAFTAATTQQQREEAVEDLQFALINKLEFLFNH
ncbi:MAG TPA: DUF1549 domain-containing protein [Thermoanaerobaculia bacterium]